MVVTITCGFLATRIWVGSAWKSQTSRVRDIVQAKFGRQCRPESQNFSSVFLRTVYLEIEIAPRAQPLGTFLTH